MWVYRRLDDWERDSGEYGVGFYDPGGEWHGDKEFADIDSAAARCHWLNGGDDAPMEEQDVTTRPEV